ncbi:hypothetical protein D9M68_969250 [compost metagenome]
MIHCASGTACHAAAKALRTASVPTWRVPQASGPAAVWKMQSAVMKPISASMSWRFQASLKAARVSVVTEVEEGIAVTRKLRKLMRQA